MMIKIELSQITNAITTLKIDDDTVTKNGAHLIEIENKLYKTYFHQLKQSYFFSRLLSTSKNIVNFYRYIQ